MKKYILHVLAFGIGGFALSFGVVRLLGLGMAVDTIAWAVVGSTLVYSVVLLYDTKGPS